MAPFRKHEVYVAVRAEVCWAVTGKGPIGATWIGISKGDESDPVYRSRSVAQKMKNTSEENNIFAATPRLEAQKVLFSMAVTEDLGFNWGEREKGLGVAFIDVK